MPDSDILIVGSGPAGVQSAWPLIKAGKNVTMLDGGNKSPHILEESPSETFEDLRRTRADQFRFLIGEDCSGIPVDGLRGGHGGGMTEGNRAFSVRDAANYLPLETGNSEIVQSLALGGLASVWGGACSFLDMHELSAMGLPPLEIQRYYKTLACDIGISGPNTGIPLQPPLQPDHHAVRILKNAERKKGSLEVMQMDIHQPYAAVLTQNMGERKATNYGDMDYITNAGHAIYRPQYSLTELKKYPNFQYRRMLVERIEEQKGGICITGKAISAETNMIQETVKGRAVILAAGAIGTARILLRSFGLYNHSIPFIAKPHDFFVCLHPAMIGSAGPKRRSSLCQLMIDDNERAVDGLNAACGLMFSYRSMQLFRLLSSIALPCPEAIALLSLWSPALSLVDVRYPARPHTESLLRLTLQDGKEKVSISIEVGQEEKERRAHARKRMRKALRMLGLLPFKTIMLPEGSCSHYGGTVPPIAVQPNAPLTVDQDSRVTGTKSIFVADASVFPCLPSKPHTLTIMTNARRIGTHLLSILDYT